MLCDRKVTNIATSQVGFITFVVQPYFVALANILPPMQYTVDQLKSNKGSWFKMTESFERQKEETGNEEV